VNPSDSFRARLRAREVLIGPFVTLSAPEVTELLADLGFDWIFIDAEHAPMGPPQIQALLQAAGRTPAVVRLPPNDPTLLGKSLDAGAAGIIAAQVNSAQQARQIVDMSKYAPIGNRGRGLARAHRYGVKLAEYSAHANDTVAVIVQAEHKDAVADIDQIVRVEGLDAVLIGPYDLASSMGHVGDVTHPEVRDAISRVRAACFEVGMPIGIFGVSAEAVTPYIEEGFTLIVVGADVLMLGDAAKTMLGRVRQVRAPRTGN
jgi:2-keto-3-deoxy-L-rhamnonate aldolase RhmA